MAGNPKEEKPTATEQKMAPAAAAPTDGAAALSATEGATTAEASTTKPPATTTAEAMTTTVTAIESPAVALASNTTVVSTADLPSTAAEALTPAEGFHSAQHWVQVTEDQDSEDDNDSAVGDDVASSTTSITSSILAYRTINGRRYHAEREDTHYWAANDDIQNESLDIIHHLLTVSLDGQLYTAPLEKDKITKALDVGTGTGIWAVDFADEHPEAEVVGTDISPIQPLWVPPNVRFEIEDFTKEWTFDDNTFDYIHMRYLYGSVPDWHALYREAYRSCKPGAWIESMECSPMIYSDDGTIKPTSAMAEWGKFFIEGGRKLGRTFEPLTGNLQEKSLQEAGFVDLQVTNMKVPIGPWPADEKLREVGRFSQLSLDSDLEGYVSLMANILLGWSREQVVVYCSQFRKELRSNKYHGYYNQRVVLARKPDNP